MLWTFLIDLNRTCVIFHNLVWHISSESKRSFFARFPSQDRAKLDGMYECILCACCMTSCPSYWSKSQILGRELWHHKLPAYALDVYVVLIDPLHMAPKVEPRVLPGPSCFDAGLRHDEECWALWGRSMTRGGNGSLVSVTCQTVQAYRWIADSRDQFTEDAETDFQCCAIAPVGCWAWL